MEKSKYYGKKLNINFLIELATNYKKFTPN